MAIPILQDDQEQMTVPQFGEPGYRKGQPNRRKGTPRRRITDGDARYLAFAGMFPGADSEAFSMLSFRQESPFGEANELPTISGAESRLRKLRSFEALDRHKQITTGTWLHCITKSGFGYARDYGYDLTHGATLNGVSFERLMHFRMIAHVAAQLASPAGFFRDTLGIEPVPFESLISEHAMRAAYEPVKAKLQEQRRNGQTADFGTWRSRQIEQIRQGNRSVAELVSAYPVLLTVGLPKQQNFAVKNVHQPDLAVLCEGQMPGESANNLLVEVELSKKSPAKYDSILQTLKVELIDRPYVYSRAVYFTNNPQVNNLLRRVDNEKDYGLFSSGKLIVLPLTHRDGTPIKQTNRVTFGGEES